MAPASLARWTEAAVEDFEEAMVFAASLGPGQAAALADGVEAALIHLRAWPASGRPGRVAGTREFKLPGLPYFLPYMVEDGAVVLVRALHTSRQWPIPKGRKHR